MRLISCHIDGFGVLRDYSLSFDGGVTTVKEPNGFGKTTRLYTGHVLRPARAGRRAGI